MGPESLPSVGFSAEGQAGVKLGSPSGDSLSPGASVSRSVCEPTTLPAQAFPVGSLLKSSMAWLLALLYLLGSRLGVAGGGREMARAGTSPGVGGPGAQLQRSLHFQRCPGPQATVAFTLGTVPLLGCQTAGAGPMWGPLAWGSEATQEQACPQGYTGFRWAAGGLQSLPPKPSGGPCLPGQ